ncbi:DUF1311 domain-containing protein [Martelella alba]|uniref:DUF1311 domain-containing protein n=2 Tax=Martelella alba TaxID=2590451 RepID=A0A506UEF4_9HYPH|nr:DUF1311 domain-containing protein [Martelella alba]
MLCTGVMLLLPVAAMAGDALACGAAATPAERLNCAEDVFRESDESLSSSFAATLLLAGRLDGSLPKGQSGAAASLMRSQRAWVDYRDSACTSRGFLFRGTEDETFIVSRCMNELTLERLHCLDRMQKVILLRLEGEQADKGKSAFRSPVN